MAVPASGRGNARLRILVVPASYFVDGRTVGGGERYALEYARAMADLSPTTLALFGRTPGVETQGNLQIRTFRVRGYDERWGFPLTIEGWRALGGYDVIHPMIFPTPMSDALILSARLRRQTVVLTDVGGGAPSWSTYLQRLHPRLSISRQAHGLALLSQHGAGLFSDWSHPRVILYGGAHVPDLDDAVPGGYALYVGRLLPHKGVLPLIEALLPGYALRVVGRPYDSAYLEALRRAAVGKDVTFILDADDDELRRQYAGANVVLQPSVPVSEGASDTSELLGLVTLEGMAHGKPVIVTRTASLPELVIDGETGFVVEPWDPEALRERIAALLDDPALSVRMGARARAHVRQRFNWEQVARAGLRFYEELRSPS